MRGFAIRSVVYILIAYGAAVAALFFFQDRLLFQPPNVSAMPVDPRFQPIALTTDDGETLEVLFLPADSSRPVVIFWHGNASAPVFAQRRALVLAEARYPVLLATYRGYGGSTGSPSGEGVKLDAMAAYDWAAANSDQPPVLYGQSLGTGAAMRVAARRPVAAVVLESPYDDLAEVAAGQYPWVPVRLLFRHRIAPVDDIGNVGVPLLIMHGNRDGLIPISHGQRLAEAGGSNVEFVMIEGAGHNDLAAFGTLEMAIAFLDISLAN